MSKSIAQSYTKYPMDFSETTVKFLQIEPTTRCNFKCEFCCGRQMDQNDLNLPFIEIVLKLFPSVQHIELQGEGEPLLHPQFFEMVKLINQRNIKVSFITNGSLLTPQKIEQILNSHIQSICISIESADKQKFREIRGGDMTTILLGIKSLIYTRNKRMQKYPGVGFAVTVLDSTKDQIPLIADLYNQLGMDGGIRLQFLSEMESYIQVYNKEIINQRISKVDEPWIFSQYIEVMQNLQWHLNYIKTFYDELEQTPDLDSSEMLELSQFFNRIFCSCPWLDQALFINRHGIVTACPKIKDTQRFALGKLDQDEVQTILLSRQIMREHVQSGNIPEQCRNCFIAESISRRLTDLRTQKPQRSLFNFNQKALSQVIGCLPNNEAIEQSIWNWVDGKNTCDDIINNISMDYHLDIKKAETMILPSIDKMIHSGILTLESCID